MKILLSILISTALFANEVQMNEANVSDSATITAQEQTISQSEESGITAKDVVAAVVTAPVWLVKKIFE